MKTKTTEPGPVIQTREQQAAALMADLRRRGAKITLHRDGQGFGVQTPEDLPICADLNNQIQWHGEEIILELREEKRKKSAKNRDLAMAE